MPFVGVIEAYVLRALRDLKLPMDEIRKAEEQTWGPPEFDDPYALAHRRVVTDGVALFVRMADKSYVHARDLQIAISPVPRSTSSTSLGLRRQCEAAHLRDFPAAADVIIDPRFGWGAPVLGQSKVKVEDLVTLWRNGERFATIADEYGLPSMSSRMSSAERPEFFLDRSLGKPRPPDCEWPATSSTSSPIATRTTPANPR